LLTVDQDWLADKKQVRGRRPSCFPHSTAGPGPSAGNSGCVAGV